MKRRANESREDSPPATRCLRSVRNPRYYRRCAAARRPSLPAAPATTVATTAATIQPQMLAGPVEQRKQSLPRPDRVEHRQLTEQCADAGDDGIPRRLVNPQQFLVRGRLAHTACEQQVVEGDRAPYPTLAAKRGETRQANHEHRREPREHHRPERRRQIKVDSEEDGREEGQRSESSQYCEVQESRRTQSERRVQGWALSLRRWPRAYVTSLAEATFVPRGISPAVT